MPRSPPAQIARNFRCASWTRSIAPPAFPARTTTSPSNTRSTCCADLTNLPLLAKLAATGKTLIVSTGMSTSDEIRAAAKFLDDRSAPYVLLHCQSTYPAALHNIHLRFMETLREIHPFVGYSGHERGIAVSIGAVAMGAVLIERHITLDREMEGPDHAASLEPEEFKALVSGIRELEAARGEKVAARDIPAGTVVAESDVAVKSPGQGLSPLKMPALIGRRLTRAMARDDYFFQSDLADGAATARRYRFDRPWGVPVRYHDTQRFLEICQPDIIEFHLSYSDMERDPAAYLSGTYDLGFVVHAPELFAGSKLMDLATADEALRRYSLEQTQAVIDITRGLKKFFPKTKRPPIVANIGGFTMDEPLPPEQKAERYRIFAQSLKELDLDGVELTPQTMAPFPWHFGGQRHQNIFIFPDESAAFCAKHDLRMCVDISHTKLAANHFGFDFARGLAQLGPHTAHLHFGDAKGLDGEGLQVGEGEIDFDEIGKVLRKHAPTASFIPEIWQGHKNIDRK